jgi:hypothetical protein
MLARKDMSLKDIVGVLKEFRVNIGDGAAEETAMHPGGPGEPATQEAETQRMILEGLIKFLDTA